MSEFVYILLDKGKCLGIFATLHEAQEHFSTTWAIPQFFDWIQESENLWSPSIWDLMIDVEIQRKEVKIPNFQRV